MPRCALLPFLFAFQVGLAAAQSSIVVTGYVTNTGAPTEFTVDRSRVQCAASTRLTTAQDGKHVSLQTCPPRSIGEKLTIHGRKDEKSGMIIANEIETESPPDRDVEGSAVIDEIIIPADASGSITVSADGYTILIPGTVHPAFEEPLTIQSPVTTNLWLKYSGTQHVNGMVTAKTAAYSLNALKGRERKANQKAEFDPASVTEKDRQSKLNMAFKGIDTKRFPASHDLQMQKRVEDIGARLIPAYQRDLPGADPSKIDFRFQVIDQPKFRDALTLSNGIILIPEQVVKQVQDDSQLATVLADNIACALEKQTLRLIPARRAETAGEVALVVGGAFVPGLGLATGISSGVTETVMKRRDEEQSGRVSLVLLREAGFDIHEAPKTWWILAAKNKPIDQVGIPYRAKYLYQTLDTTWRSSASGPAAPLPAAQ